MTFKILVVDDVPFNVKLFRVKLENLYFDVIAAENGLEAVEKIRKENPDLVLMDVMMPLMDGNEATRIIKSDPRLCTIPVIIVTALNAVEDKIKALKSGADDFITKPVNDQTFMARIKSLLRLKSLTDELILRNQTVMQFGGSNEAPSLSNMDFSIKGMHVLLLDDDIGQIKKITNLLVGQKAIVNTFSKVKDAHASLSSNTYDLIIANSQMINEDPLRLCSYAHNDERLKNIPILIIADENDVDIIDKAFDLGVSDCITPPVEVNELLARCYTQLRRKQYQDALERLYKDSVKLSIVDDMTNLFNRRYFNVHIPKIMADMKEKEKNLAIMVLDIDFFKRMNDTYGHSAGDMVLKQFAEVLNRYIRSHDTCIRMGGEEFLIALSDITPELAKEVASRIRESVEKEKFAVEGNKIEVTCSIGLSMMQKNDGIETLVGRADKALYKAKNSGRNRVEADF